MVKPAPASVRQFVQGGSQSFSSSPSHWTNQHIHSVERNLTKDFNLEEEEELPVDYAFLDEDEENDYNDINSVNFRFKKRRKRDVSCQFCVKTGVHIVYKRKDVSDSHHGDYSKCFFS